MFSQPEFNLQLPVEVFPMGMPGVYQDTDFSDVQLGFINHLI